MIYPSGFEQKLGFIRIRELLGNLCIAAPGKDEVDAIRFSTSHKLIEEMLKQLEEMILLLNMYDHFPVPAYDEIRPMLRKSRLEGAWMEIPEILLIRKSLESARELQAFFQKEDEAKFQALRRMLEGLKLFPVILKKIDEIIDAHGRIRDNASVELAAVRREMRSAQENISKKLNQILRQAQREGWAEEDTSLTLRDGRMVIPMKAADKRRIRGFVHDESATGKTVYLEPAEIVDLNNSIKEFEYAERREIVKILQAFTTFLTPYAEDLALICEKLGKIDFLRAKGLLAGKLNAIVPSLRDEPLVEWVRAIHPILYLNHSREGKEVIPLDIELNKKKRILIISGPNAGGKSVCLQTLGLLQYMLQCGLAVPASPNSVFGIFSDIFLDIGDEQSIENDLSTYSSHLLNMKHFLKNAGEQSLILIDEFGAGTEPMLGGAIAESILDKLNRNSCFGVITTHYTNLKHFASSAEGIINGAMLFDTNKMQPLFKLETGKPGSSFAFEIARRIGLPEDILQAAKERIGTDHIDFDRHLKDALRDKRYWEQKRERIRTTEKKLEETLERYSEELEKAKKLRKEILDKAKVESSGLLDSVNRKIENTIREIRESSAQKEKTKDLRKELDDFSREVRGKLEEDDATLKEHSERVHERKKKFVKVPEPGSEETIVKNEDSAIGKGDKVRMINQDTVGEVLDVNGKSIMVAFGHMTTTIDERRLEKVSEKEYRKNQRQNPPSSLPGDSVNVSQRRLEFKTDIDVRGLRGDAALQKIQQFTDEAFMLGITELRILHGKGNGILRIMIRDYLKALDFVQSAVDAHVDFGGAGITVVKLGI
jgi:DNA mismatch repair protein MutS2